MNLIIYAEVSIRYSQIEDLDAALPKAMIDREPIPYEAAFLGGRRFVFTCGVEGRSDLRFQTFSSVLTRRCQIRLVHAQRGPVSHIFP
jgi:hypothetical protein